MARAVRAKTQADAGDIEQPLLPIEAPQRQKSRIGRKNLSGRVDPPIARAFAVLAAMQDRTQEDLLNEAVRDLLQKYRQEPVESR